MPARPISAAMISFGLVSIPVRLFTATSPKSVSFHLLHNKDKSRIQQKIYCHVDDKIIERDGVGADDFEGVHSEDGRVIGTSIHGLFDAAGFRRNFLDTVRQSKGLAALALNGPDDPNADRRTAFDRLADVLEAHVDMSRVAALAGVNWKCPLPRASSG